MLKKKLKLIAKDWLPPAVATIIQRLRKKGLIFEGNYSSWKLAEEKSSGYDSEHILNKVLTATLKVKNNEAAYERDSVLFTEIEYSWPLLSSLLWAAARSEGSLNVLDFGGSLGSSYFQNRKFLLSLPTLKWNIIEQNHYVQAGQNYIQDEHLKFYHNIDACLEDESPNVILLSGVLQYVEQPDEIIDLLPSIGAKYLIVDRTPFSSSKTDHLAIQHVPPSIYSSSYPMWVFARSRLENLLQKKWNIIARHKGSDGSFKTSEGLEFCFEGILLERKNG